MTESLELIKINLNLHEGSMTVQGIIFSGNCPTDLNFDHLINLSDLPCLDIPTSASHLAALIYETTEASSDNFNLSLLLKEGNSYRLGVFSEPNKDFGILYIIAHCEDKSGLGSYFNGAKFGMFVYHYKEVLGENVRNYISYIRVMKIAKSNFIRKTQLKFKEYEEKKEEKKHYEEMAEYLSKRSIRLKEELETAKLAIQQLNYQLEKKKIQLKERQEQNLVCTVCRTNMKNIVFLPCGHIILCKICLIETFGAAPNGMISKKNPIKCASCKNPIKCASCKNPVKESKEVHF